MRSLQPVDIEIFNPADPDHRSAVYLDVLFGGERPAIHPTHEHQEDAHDEEDRRTDR